MRLFIAINFPVEIKESLQTLINELHDNSFSGTFSTVQNLHLTLAFLGECDGRETALVKSVLKRLEYESFSLTFGKTGRFRREEGDVRWIGVRKNEALARLQRDLTDRLREAGFRPDEREFRPHVTLGRRVNLRQGYSPQEPAPLTFDVISVELMKSERIQGKLTYTAVYNKNFATSKSEISKKSF
ncbi:MAG: RNA 2',3'-cyclic phosphodiesterase [Fusobacteriaceae bacterium]|jgi:2'-5' RNA ligase|nr:RNA 2',3'-cyclic phosphodiesterase [Fusobacteriaceae bacterium]